MMTEICRSSRSDLVTEICRRSRSDLMSQDETDLYDRVQCMSTLCFTQRSQLGYVTNSMMLTNAFQLYYAVIISVDCSTEY